MASVLLVAGIGVLIVPLVSKAISNREVIAPLWNVGLLIGVFVALVAGARRRVEWCARALLVVSLTGAITLPAATRVDLLANPPWIANLQFTTAAAVCLLASRWWVSVLAVLALVLAQTFLYFTQTWSYDGETFVGDVILSVAVAAIGYTVYGVLRRTEEQVSAAETTASGALTTARDVEARVVEARQWDAFVHDEVLATLTKVAAGDIAGGRKDVRRLLDGVEALRRGEPPVPSLTYGIVEAVLANHPSTETDLRVAADAIALPDDVRRALVEATSEAVRNIARHAWSAALPGRSEVLVTHDADGVVIVVRDEGVGFDPDRVPPTRLGLAVSVHARLASVGGTSMVRSAPGRGTVIKVVWSR